MRVCVFGLRGFPEVQGGVEMHCEHLYRHLSQDCAEFTIFRRKPYVSPGPHIPNISFVDLPSSKLKGFEPLFHSFLATICSLFKKPDIIHVHNIGPALFCPFLKLFHKKVVVTYHSPNYEHQKWGRLAKSILILAEKCVLWFSDKIIFVNKFQMERLPRQYSSKYVFIPNGYDDNVSVTSSCDLIARYGLEKGNYILALGRITPEKGFDILLNAFSEIDDVDIKLCIAGNVETENSYYSSLTKAADERVVFTGYVTGELKRQLYSNARLFVLPSRNEGFPLVLLDAMAYGRDLVVSDIPATHLVDLPDSDYFRTDDAGALKRIIEGKLKNGYQTRNYDLTSFTWTSIARKTFDVYNSII